MPVRIPYGLKDGRLLHVSEVSSGQSCGCVHPVLGVPLLAKKGKIRRHHFSSSAHGQSASFESFVHLLAKQLLNERGALSVPSATLSIDADTSDWSRDFVVGKSTVVEIANVQAEKKIQGSNFVCDNVGEAEWGSLLIEWRNTHETDEKKRGFLVDNKIRSLEIDISGWEECSGREELEEWILHKSPRSWIYDSRLDESKLSEWGLNVERKPCYSATRFLLESGRVRPFEGHWVKDCPILGEIVSTRKCRCCPFLKTIEYYASAYVDCFGRSKGAARRRLLNKGAFSFTWPSSGRDGYRLFSPIPDSRKPKYGNGFKRGWDAPRTDLPLELVQELKEAPRFID